MTQPSLPAGWYLGFIGRLMHWWSGYMPALFYRRDGRVGVVRMGEAEWIAFASGVEGVLGPFRTPQEGMIELNERYPYPEVTDAQG